MTPMEKADRGLGRGQNVVVDLQTASSISGGQFDDTLCRVLIDALQHINQVSIGLNVVQLADRQQTLNDAEPLCANFCPSKQPVSPTQWNRSQTAL